MEARECVTVARTRRAGMGCFASDRSGEDVPVFWVVGHGVDQWLPGVSIEAGGGERFVHEPDRAMNLGGRIAWIEPAAFNEKSRSVPDHLGLDLLLPERPVKVLLDEAQEKVSECWRYEDAGIEDTDGFPSDGVQKSSFRYSVSADMAASAARRSTRIRSL